MQTGMEWSGGEGDGREDEGRGDDEGQECRITMIKKPFSDEVIRNMCTMYPVKANG